MDEAGAEPMTKIVAGISMSHAPLMLAEPDAPEPGMRARMADAVGRIASYLDAARPDVMIAFLDDHFENHYRNLMPTFSIGVAGKHAGPADYWLEALKLERKEDIPSDERMAEWVLGRLLTAGFDVARMGSIEYGNNLMVPLKLIRPQNDIPIIPVFVNVFSPPLTSMSRAYALGQAVRLAVEAAPGNARAAFLATGGLSHWPPVWGTWSPESDAFLKRMKRFQTEGRPVLAEDPKLLNDLATYEMEMARTATQPLVNAKWDRAFLDALARGDTGYVRGLSYEEIDAEGGHGGHEVLLWSAMMGAMGGRAANVLSYEPVTEWICGMGFAVYDL
jgi:2,3-dihydroxyphenylpropionate 1,2-dioxygenase